MPIGEGAGFNIPTINTGNLGFQGLGYSGFTANNWQVNSTSTPWWQSLLQATGQTFVNGLAATYNANNQGNPYNAAGLPASNILMYGLLALVAFKFLK